MRTNLIIRLPVQDEPGGGRGLSHPLSPMSSVECDPFAARCPERPQRYAPGCKTGTVNKKILPRGCSMGDVTAMVALDRVA